MNNFNINNYKNIHMIGIGGISMSGIAEILASSGFNITGSDTTQSEITDKLCNNNVKVYIGHNIEAVKKADLIVYTAAIKPNDIELVEAQKNNIPTIERGEFLGEITKLYKNTICISGTHGKTTTTSMVSLCFIEAQKDPTIQVGAILNNIDGNYLVGHSETLIIEACEYVESFLKFHPKSEIILNIDNDHLDYFKNIENIKKSFYKYASILPKDGILVFNADDINSTQLPENTTATCLTFGIENTNANFTAQNITKDNNGFYEFEIYKNNKFYGVIRLHVPGKHNIYNTLACITLCDYYGISFETIKTALSKFTGAKRRFDYIGSYKNAKIYDDYAHHPTEIEALAKAVNDIKHNETWAIFQSHTYSRTQMLIDDFAKALANFDHIIITDIYAAREINTFGIEPKHLVEKIKSLGKDSKYIGPFTEIAQYIRNNVKENDIILTIGAGTITNLGTEIIK